MEEKSRRNPILPIYRRVAQTPHPMSASESNEGGKIGLLAATAIVVGNMVGVGVFTSLGYQLSGMEGGFSLIFLWVLGGVYSLMGALCYAELASALPRSGGEYHLLSQTLHPAVGFAAGWLSSTVGFAAPVALVAIAFGSYLGGVFGYGESAQAALSISLIVVVTACHLHDVKFGSRFQLAATALKVALVAGLALCGFVLGTNQGMSFLPGEGTGAEIFSKDFATSFYFVTFSYSGWNAAAYIVGEVRDPQRSVPRALLIGTAFVTVLYVLVNAAFLYSTPVDKMVGQKEVGLIAARSIFGESGGNMVGVLIALGLGLRRQRDDLGGTAGRADDGRGPPPTALLGAAHTAWHPGGRHPHPEHYRHKTSSDGEV